MNIKGFLRSSLAFPLSAFLIAVLIINPLGEFIINDDWLFSRQVLAFTLGQFKINSLIDPVFILQGVLGYGWAKIFGFSHSALRILTIIITIGAAVGLHRTLRLLDISAGIRKLALIVFLFNPLVFSSALSFMTENYFLFFFIWSLYFYLKYLRFTRLRELLLASIFVGLSFLVRQVGVLTFAAFVVIDLLFYKNNPTQKIKKLVISSSPVIISLIIFALWPRYPSEIGMRSADFLTNTIKGVAGLKILRERWILYLFSFVYFSYFLLPLAAYLPVKPKKIRTTLFLFFISVIITYPVFKFDLFPIGSTFYLEGLHVKSFAQQNFSLFDNIPFKLLLSFLISFSLNYLVYGFWRKGQIYKEKSNAFLITVSAFNFLILLAASDFYARYLLVPFLPLLLLVAANIFELYEVRSMQIPVFIITVLFIFITFTLQWDFFARTRLGWQQAELLGEKYDLVTNIYLSGPYEKYMKAVKDNNFSGYNESPTGDYKCYIYDYTLDTDSKFLQFTQGLNEKIENKILENPGIYGGRKPQGQPKIKNNLDKLELNERYLSLPYKLVGKNAYVGSFCPFE